MRKSLLILVAVLALFIATGCKKDDSKSEPKFSGNDTLEITRGAAEPAWINLLSVSDKEDGAIGLTLDNVDTGDFNVDIPGEYDVIYTVQDSDGNETTFTLKVTVIDPFANRVIPALSNPDEVYGSVNGFTVTKGELYKEMKLTIGYNSLVEMIERSILDNYITNVTNEESEEAYKLLLFGTTDEKYIEKITSDDELYEELLNSVNNQLVFAGYDPDSMADVYEYLALGIAKANYAKDIMKQSVEGDKYYVSDEMLQNYYETTKKGDICLLSVRFSSSSELADVLDMFNIVPNYNYGFGGYFGTTPIEQLTSDAFNESNTKQLSDSEAFDKYVELYNYAYPNQMITNTTMQTYCDDYSDIAMMSFEELYEGVTSSDHPGAIYADYVYNSLQIDDPNGTRYTYSSKKIYSDYVMTFKVEEYESKAFETLTNTELEELLNDFADDQTNNEVISNIMKDALASQTLALLDPDFRISYEFENSVDLVDVNDPLLVARFGDLEITADDLFNFLEPRLGLSIFMTMYETDTLLSSDIFETVFGEERDLVLNDSEKVLSYKEQLTMIKDAFNTGNYVSYGFDPAILSYDEFLTVAFGMSDTQRLIMNYFMKQELNTYYAYENLPEYNSLLDYMNEKMDQFFRVDIQHLLFLVDFDQNFIPDDFSDFKDELSESELTQYQAMKLEIETIVFDKLGDGYSFEDIVEEYNETLVSDTSSVWHNLKVYGFKIKVEDLGTIDYTNAKSLDVAFANEVEVLANDLQRSENANEDEIYSDGLTESDFGIHILLGIRNEDGVKPTAYFEELDALDPQYTEGSENDNVLPSELQINLFEQMRLEEVVSQETDIVLPSSVKDAILYLYGEIFTQYTSTWGTNLMNIHEVLEGNVTFSIDNDLKQSFLIKQQEALLQEAKITWEYRLQ